MGPCAALLMRYLEKSWIRPLLALLLYHTQLVWQTGLLVASLLRKAPSHVVCGFVGLWPYELGLCFKVWWAETQALYDFLCDHSLLAAPIAGPQLTTPRPTTTWSSRVGLEGSSGAWSAFFGNHTIHPLWREPSPWATFPVFKSEEETGLILIITKTKQNKQKLSDIGISNSNCKIKNEKDKILKETRKKINL